VLGMLALANLLIGPGLVLALLAAVYTAFLFGQAEGRDLWQSPLLPFHLFVQSLAAGAAGLLIAGLFVGLPPAAVPPLAWTLVSSLLLSLLLTVGGEFGVPHASQVATAAAHLITHGRFARWYWAGLIGGTALPLALALAGLNSLPLLALAGALSLAGLFAYEWAFVMAPQEVPNS
jgi:Ni/Fe-hydrogenase subunit HybB-like protein